MFFRERGTNPLVIVLSPGKSGSSSVYNTIKQILSMRVEHLHFISPSGISKEWSRNLKGPRRSVPLHLLHAFTSRDTIFDSNRKRFVFVIVRDPREWVISAIFQNLDTFDGALDSGCNVNFEIVEREVGKSFKSIGGDLDQWFDEEIKKPFGIDVFSSSSKKSQCVEIFENGNVKLLLEKIEELKAITPEILNSFFETTQFHKEFQFSYNNVSKNKFYGTEYLEFKSKFQIDHLDYKNLMQSRYVQKFYGQDFV